MPDNNSPGRTPRAVSTDGAFSCAVNNGRRDAVWIRLRGNLNEHALPQFQAALEKSVAEQRLVVVDLRGLTSVDDAGLDEIERFEGVAIENNARLVLIRPRAHSDGLAGLSRLSERMMVVDTDLDGAKPKASKNGSSRKD